MAALRQQCGLTQAALAERLGVKQQAWATYETATRRLPSSLLLPTTQALGVTLEQLLDASSPKAKRGPVPKLQRQFQEIASLPPPKQKFISEFLDTVLQAKAG
ncbi:helix-turn-helix transcriptional regulator [Verrucomicrobium sp. BvORR034]|uniref:helix-turn-helix domain-containing protein n=1 Tax=Verrucomicrobium sp. BvORR034 TaxID=1396418 RepID=UPI0007C75F09|nr:helix-turn-helix transcriptional regulator [Verrucomicrobium sp. BvORR034]